MSAEIEAENRRLAERCAALERRHGALLALYVATARLHGSLDRNELLTALEEILASLLGCEAGARFELDGRVLRPQDVFGRAPEQVGPTALGEGVIGRAVADATVYVAQAGERAPEGVNACVPLLLDGRPIGALVLYELLAQKPALDEGDRELLALLSTQLAVALRASELHSRFGGVA